MKNFLTLYWKESLGLEGSKLLIPSGDPRNGVLLACHAPSSHDLHDLIQRQREFLKNNRDNLAVSDDDVFSSYSTEKEHYGKEQSISPTHCFRAAFVASSFSSLYDQLLTYDNSLHNCQKEEDKTKIAMLFTGQGSQYHGMARELYTTSSAFRKGFDAASKLLLLQHGLKVKDVMYGDQGHLLDTSLYSQTSIFCLEIGMVSFWQSFGITPSFVLGPSAGGFAAAVAASAVTLEDGARLVGGRAKLINSLPEGGMTAVASSQVKVQALIDQLMAEEPETWLDIAVINSEKDVVIAGRPQVLEAFEGLCSSKGVKTTRLKAKQAFHSREIDTICEQYAKIILQIVDKGESPKKTLLQPPCKYISGIDGTVMTVSQDFTEEYWQSHARAMVDLPAAVKSLWDQGARVFIEVGPRPVLIHDAKEILGGEKASKGLWIPSMSRQKENENEDDASWITILQGVGSLFEAGIIEFDQIK